MDIDLLSKMVKELILDNDKVVLPGLGCFVAEIMPSTFSDKGYTINPPYRRMYFRTKPDQDDALTRFYASSNKVETEVAERIVKDFVAELKVILHSKKTVVFPGLGRLRATKENNIFFVADEDLDIYPAGFGLEPISLKTHQETEEEVTAAVEGLKHYLTGIEPAPVKEMDVAPEAMAVETEVVEKTEVVEETETEVVEKTETEVVEKTEAEVVEKTEVAVEEPVPVEEKRKSRNKFLISIVVLIVLTAILFIAYIVVSKVAPELLDQFLYTPEELEILNYIIPELK